MRVFGGFVLGFLLATVVPVFAQTQTQILEHAYVRIIGLIISATGDRIARVYLTDGPRAAFNFADRLSACVSSPFSGAAFDQAGQILSTGGGDSYAAIDVVERCGTRVRIGNP